MLSCVAFAQDEGGDDAVPPKVLAVYQEGKSAYDAKDYARALERFDRCVDLDPARARWHYNRGLALKKLKRDREAREAFNDARRMDPSYKQREIDQKLSELGDEPSPSASTPRPVRAATDEVVPTIIGFVICLVPPAVLVVAVVLVVRAVRRRNRSQDPTVDPASRPTGPPRAELLAQLAALARRQTPLEHALAGAGDPQGQALVTRAGTALLFARQLSEQGDNAALGQAVTRASAAVDQATRHFEAKGPGWDQLRGERVGCFFCARPLAATSARRGVVLTTDQGRAAVVACEVCAQKAAAGTAVPVRVVGQGAQQQHWAQVPAFDPYQHAFWDGPASHDVPAWEADLSGARLSALAPLVGLAAVGAGAAALVVFDVMAGREAALAASAAAAAASASRSSRSERWSDHS